MSYRPCTEPGCPELIASRKPRCPAHASEYERARPSEGREVYDRQLWRRVRRAVLHRANYRCEWPGCEEIDNLDIDHRIPIAEGGERFAQGNLWALCRVHHRRKEREGLPEGERPQPRTRGRV